MSNNSEDNMQIAITEDIAQGLYSNFALINKSTAEFVLDFVQVLPGTKQPSVKSRIIVAPLHAKRLKQMLETQLAEYEQQHGEITDADAIAAKQQTQA